MPRIKRSWVFASGTAIAASLLAIASPAGAVFVAYGVAPSPSVGTGYNTLNGVSEVPGTAFAVGWYDNGTTQRSLIERYSGGSWSVMTSANEGTEENELNGVVTLSSTSAFAVGGYYNYASWHTLAEAWNGTSWKVQSTPSILPHDNWLMNVAASSPTNVWAVGYYLLGSTDAQRTLIEHYNGTKWSIVPSPNVGRFDNYLLKIAMVPGTNGTQAWAVGYYNVGGSSSSTTKNLILHLSGGKWSVVPTPNVGTQSNWIHAVSALSTRSAYAVGWSDVLSGSTEIGRTLVEYWNGSAWRVVPSANNGSYDNNFKAVVEVNSRNVTAFGYYYDGTADQTLVEHLEGHRFVVVPSADASSEHNNLLSASYAPGEPTWSVGLYDSGTSYRTLIETCSTC